MDHLSLHLWTRVNGLVVSLEKMLKADQSEGALVWNEYFTRRKAALMLDLIQKYEGRVFKTLACAGLLLFPSCNLSLEHAPVSLSFVVSLTLHLAEWLANLLLIKRPSTTNSSKNCASFMSNAGKFEACFYRALPIDLL